jgi:NAD+ kinase
MALKVAVYCKDITEKTRVGICRLARIFLEKGIAMNLNVMGEGKEKLSESDGLIFFEDISSIPGEIQIIISVGGDGTFLETAMRVKDKGIPVAGINTGKLGFLANITDADINNAIEKLCNGEYDVIERSMLELISPGNIFNNNYPVALNEITVQKADQRMITIAVQINGIHINTYRADGLIVSTATGSTAYNLSVGGPILTPTDGSVVIAPMSPHNLTVRPIVVTGGSNITMEVSGRGYECLVTCDSRFTHLPFGTLIEIRQAEKRLRTVMLKGDDFFSTLRNKFLWGVDPRN